MGASTTSPSSATTLIALLQFAESLAAPSLKAKKTRRHRRTVSDAAISLATVVLAPEFKNALATNEAQVVHDVLLPSET